MEILKEKIAQYLHPSGFFDLTVAEEVASTNATVKEWGIHQKKEGSVLIARRQTAGRGRLGRTFFSPDSGVYFSVLLRPRLSPEQSLLITTAAAVAVAEAIGDAARIKWVNDVYRNGKKVCGILTESALMGDKLDFAVLGIGLNLCPPQDGFPEELQEIAGGIFEAPPSLDTTARLVAEILNRFYEWYQDLTAPEILAAYQQRNLLQGKTVTVGRIRGVVEGINENFALLIKDEAGQIHTIAAGEATIGSTGYQED